MVSLSIRNYRKAMVILGAIGALVAHAITRRQPMVREAPWRLPVLGFLGFQVLSLVWSTSTVLEASAPVSSRPSNASRFCSSRFLSSATRSKAEEAPRHSPWGILPGGRRSCGAEGLGQTVVDGQLIDDSGALGFTRRQLLAFHEQGERRLET